MNFMRLAEPQSGHRHGPVSVKIVKACNDVDSMSAPVRRLVHEFGYPVVKAFLDCGIKREGTIRHLILECWKGPRSSAQSGQAGRVIAQLDWLLINAGAQINAMTLLSILGASDLAIVPREPNKPMLDASMNTVANHDVSVTKQEKHRRRIRAAIEGAVVTMWPHLARR